MYNPITHMKNQFATPSVNDYPDVYIPLEKVERHPSMSLTPGGRLEDPEKVGGTLTRSSDDKTLSDSPARGGGMSMESLRAQLEHEAQNDGMNSVYDRRFFDTLSVLDVLVIYPHQPNGNSGSGSDPLAMSD